VWSPDGTRLAYVSFENKKPIVYVHSIGTGKRHVVANFKGSNSAPAWSPDGRRLAVVLSKDGGSQLFLVNADGSGGAQRLMSSPGIDTEPYFAPDGQWIYFTSDRGGSRRSTVSRPPAARPSASPSTAATTSARGRRRTARRWPSSPATAAASSSASWIWPAGKCRS